MKIKATQPVATVLAVTTQAEKPHGASAVADRHAAELLDYGPILPPPGPDLIRDARRSVVRKVCRG
jgi:hypothetical protein